MAVLRNRSICTFFVLSMAVVSRLFAVTIYVDATNSSDVAQAGTLSHPWASITGAVVQLATENGIVKGGHTVSVAAGAYSEQVNLTVDHEGIDGSPNSFITTNGAVIEGVDNCFSMLNVDYIVIYGFKLTGSTSYAVSLGEDDDALSCRHNVIERCNICHCGRGVYVGRSSRSNHARFSNIYANDYSGVFIWSKGGILIDNCTIFGCTGSGVYVGSETVVKVKNSNIVNNNGWGIYERYSTGDSEVYFCNIYGNGQGCLFDSDTSTGYNTESEINSMADCSNNIARLPGFAGLDDNWNFNSFYENSPCLGSGEGGVNIGVYQYPDIMEIGSNIYYVDSTTGSDVRTSEEAMNPGTPWATISRASKTARAGDSVSVAAGVYFEDVAITNGGSYDSPVTYIANGDVIVTGVSNSFLFRRVAGVETRGFALSSADVGMRFEYAYANYINNARSYVNSVGVQLADVSCRNSFVGAEIYSNVNYGVQSYLSGGNTFECCRITECGAYGIALGTSSGYGSKEITIDRCLVRGCDSGILCGSGSSGIYLCNTAVFGNNGYGIQTYKGAHLTLENCVLCRNGGSGISVWAESSARFRNCNIVSNSQYGVRERYSNAQVYLGFCDLYGNDSGNYYDRNTSSVFDTAPEINALDGSSNNIVAYPVFRNPACDDYRIMPDSPCKDAGTPTTDLDTDYFGQPRLVGPAVDIGFYELPCQGSVFVFD